MLTLFTVSICLFCIFLTGWTAITYFTKKNSQKFIVEELKKLFGICKRNKIKVNSAHHQSVYKIGKDLTVSAKASDGIIEGIEHKKHRWCIGLQWHPEFLITKFDLKIFKNFIENI